MTFVFWWPVLYGLVLLEVLVLWVKTDDRNQKTGIRNQKSENSGQKIPVRASGGNAREITSIRREASLLNLPETLSFRHFFEAGGPLGGQHDRRFRCNFSRIRCGLAYS